MAEKSHRGRFVWYELMTTDPQAAQDFYTEVVGWKAAPFEGAPVPYTMWMKGDTPESAVGGLMDLPVEARSHGVPPHWMGYVAVPDVDATAARVEELGGGVLVGPDDIPNVGRFVVFHDPQGAALSAYRSVQDIPVPESEPEPEPGDVSWRELATTNHQEALRFYSDLFGWDKADAMDMGEAGVYQMYARDGCTLGGMYDKSPDQPGPPAWLYYFKVGDLDEAVRTIGAKGGTVVVGPMEVPGGGRIAAAIDPQGAYFALHQSA